MTAPNVRAATVDDAAGIAHVHMTSWRETYSPLVEPGELDELSEERRAEWWTSILQLPDAFVYVAVLDGEIIGFAGASERADGDRVRDRQLESIYLLAGHQGSGAGQALLDAALGDAPAFLFVARGNPRAIRFYQRNGFAFDGASEEFPLVRTPITSLRMVR